MSEIPGTGRECFATDGRFRFIDSYFGGRSRGGSEDTDAIRRTLVDLIAYVIAEEKTAVTDYLGGRVDSELREEALALTLRTCGVGTGIIELLHEQQVGS